MNQNQDFAEEAPLMLPSPLPEGGPSSPSFPQRLWQGTKTLFIKPEYLDSDVSRESSLAYRTDKPASPICSGDGTIESGDVKPLPEKKKELSFIGLIAVCYFLVCGGAYGTEDLASTIPPLFALLAVLIVPWVWSMPIALIVAELGSSMPSNHGFLGWIGTAWGQGAAFFDGWIMIITIIIDQSIYPVIFVSYLGNVYEFSDWQKFLISVAYILVGLTLNLAGVASVGGASTALSFMTLVPFAIYVICGLASDSFDPSRWLQMEMDPEAELNIALFLSVLVWCTCAYEYSGFLCGDVNNPQRTFPIAMFTVVFMMIATYLLPLSVTIATAEDLGWVTDGAYPDLASNLIGGDWLAWLMVVGGLASTMGTYITYLHTSSTALHSLSEEGMAPAIFNALPQMKAPIVPMLFFSATTAVLVNFEFSVLIQIESFIYCVHAIMLCSCLLRLRLTKPEMERPFALPFGLVGAIVVPLLPMLIGLAQMVSLFAESYWQALISIGVLLLGISIYCLKRAKPWLLDFCTRKWRKS